MKALHADPKRKFTYVEMKFFTMWYNRQNEKTKDLVKYLVGNGQLEITQGGWSSTDEACPNYEDIINNMYLGHMFLKKEFGVIPKIGWMIDAFGHSTANAALFADFGFDAVFFSRIDLPERTDREKGGNSTFIWRPFSKHFGN